MRKIKATKEGFSEPVKWVSLAKKRAVFYKIDTIGQVMTTNGEMTCVHIKQQRVDLANPDTDIIVLVGKVDFTSNVVLPELWYWKDKFWVKAINSDGHPYYSKKQYVLYEVEVDNPEGLMENLNHSYD